MSGQLQLRRGGTIENDAFTGVIGELTYDTEKKDLRIHDGQTQGGIKIPTEQTADYVVDFQVPTAENNYVWYRKYKSGWVEQGGPQGTTNTTINLPVEMANTNYTVDCGIHIANYGEQTLTKRTTSFSTGSVATNVGTTGGWTVKGMAA